MNPASGMKALRGLLAEIYDLKKALAVLHWDQQTQMPPGGHPARGQQMTTLNRIIHEKSTSPRLAEALEAAEAGEKDLDPKEEALLRVARRDYQKATRVPVELVARMSQISSTAYQDWLKARVQKDFAVFQPSLTEMAEVMREVAEALGYQEDPLDALIDYREPGITLAALEDLFGGLRSQLVPLAAAIAEKSDLVSEAPFLGDFEPQRQLDMGMAAVRSIGFDPDHRGRKALSVHPFCTTFSSDDVRITTRVKREDLRACFFSLLHEAGHGTYNQGIPGEMERTPLHGGASAGMHESQSRLWENVVGRSLPFWEYFMPVARAFFPQELGRVSPEEMYRAANSVKPGFIRVEADEVTYNLHIMVRFEVEKGVFSGDLPVKDIPGLWNEKMKEYLGVVPPDDLLGCLQDIHWTMSFGAGFQGYTLGNVMAAALYRKARESLPGLEDQWRRGDFSGLLSWMKDNVHAHGASLKPEEVLQKATGEGLTIEPYITHLKEKYGDIYQL